MLLDSFFAPEPDSAPLSPAQVFELGMRHHHIANTAYPIGHLRTYRSLRLPREMHEAMLRSSLQQAPKLGLYLHVPFCERRCHYCEYTVLDAADASTQDSYLRALQVDLEHQVSALDLQGKCLVGLDIGGGTPGLIEPARLRPMLDNIRESFRLDDGFEISIETTPRLAAHDRQRLDGFAQLGIARISMGLQMVNAHLLDLYGRDFNAAGDNHTALKNMRDAGFRRINLDLMYGFAKQTSQDFEATLDAAIALAPDYITLYRMRYKGTRIAEEAAQVPLSLVSDLYELAQQRLSAAGYHAPPGKNTFTRSPSEPGTSAYLTQRVTTATPYLGIGLGAQTFTTNLLAYNQGAASKTLGAYLRDTQEARLPIQDMYHLPKSEGLGKAISVSFYFGQVDLAALSARFDTDLRQHFHQEIDFVLREGLMRLDHDVLQLTALGAKAFSGVISLFYSNQIKQHLRTR